MGEVLAARGCAIDGTFLESRALHPQPAAGAGPLLDLFGNVWEHTRSAYAPYPGFRPLAGALGEYNGKFMSGQLVLRGGSCATPRSHIRPTYRSFSLSAHAMELPGHATGGRCGCRTFRSRVTRPG